MCRITGAIDFSERITTENVLIEMRDSMFYGGPDSGGVYIDGPVSLAHRRLSIIDLSKLGCQPLISGKWVISFNGEIYNFEEIRDELVLKGYTFESRTDTEVIVKSVDCWGMESIKKFRGMFAFALWNTDTKRLILCRDRFGVKPLFYYQKDNLLLFSSELKAFHAHPYFDKTLDLSGIPHYLSKGFFHESDCIYKYVHKVAPGSYMEIGLNKNISITKFWDIEDKCNNSILDIRPEDELLIDLEDKLLTSFKRRMIADVEVGIFLSGGIDSSLVTALLQSNYSKPLRTYTIGFHDKRFNEASDAEKIADILGTNHSTLYCTEEECKLVIPSLPYIYDEPFGDSSAIATCMVSKMASSDVKVALSGDGGDELFGGYSKYLFMKNAQMIMLIPEGIRKQFYRMSGGVNPLLVSKLVALIGMNKYTQVEQKFYKFRQILLANNIDDFFEKSSIYLGDREMRQFFTGDFPTQVSRDDIQSISNLQNFLSTKDFLSYLPGDILTKVDRASMQVSLEVREPFLDPEILEFAFSIPSHFKISRKNESKYILKQILGKYIPEELIKKPKRGFTVPIENWLREFLKEELLSLQNDNVFFETFQLNQKYFQSVLTSFFAFNYKYNHNFIWFVYCLFKWYKKWV